MVENYSKDILTDGELPDGIKLSEATIKKFVEINGEIDTANEEVLEEQTKKEETAKLSTQTTNSVRKKDEGLNEDGTVKLDEENTSEISDEKPDKPVAEKKEVETKLSLPNRLVQAAHRNHLSDEDIVKLGDRAETVLSAMADNSDKISAELGELGRLRKEALRGKITEPETKLKQIEIEGLDSADPMVQLINKGFETVNQRISVIEQRSATTQATEVDMQIDKFFDVKTKQFPQLGDSAALSPFQLGIRKSIYNVADNIFVGAQATGKPITLNNALEAALSIYEKEDVTKQVRSKIIEDVKNREAQLTSRPSQRKTEQIIQEPIKAAQGKVREFWRKKGVNIDVEGAI
jgi:hypothetical protein